ncbi:MAG: serine/threonine-protein kinase, partial [Planctomycetota bacterium JB042]
MSDEPLDLDDELEVDALCGRFESARRAGETLDVPAFVAAAPARLRERLEEELTALETELAAADDAAPVPAALPARLGRYRVVAKIGEGGMGAVYEAVQDRPRRRVALKVVRAELTSPATTRRFDREVKLLGHLHHPGIAQIFEAGVEPARDGRPAIPYLVMELVRGEPLLAHAAERALDVRGRLELVRRICDAVQHAHDQGVVHRDLKPADILVIADDRSSTTRGGAGFVDLGRPKVLDFGVARATGEDAPQTLETRVGQLVGTISHMSPEQLEGDSAAVDERADVYAIGVILYELLAGRLPHDVSGLSLPAAIERIRTEEPTRLGLVDPRLRGDVEVIVARAMEKDRRRRYPSALELAADLQRHLDDEP